MPERKHAYLIIAHNEPDILATLLRLLDDGRNDIYLHIDRRAAAMRQRFAAYRPKRSGFVLLKDPLAVCWGDISQVEVEYRLFSAAAERGKYLYYHLLSGVDMPLRTQDAIHSFFEDNKGKEFVGFWQSSAHRRDLRRKVSRYYVFTRHLKDKHTLVHHLTSPLRNLFLLLQKVTCFRRSSDGYTFQKGSNWVSITDAFCRYLLSERPRIMRRMRHTLCPDEIFLQTVLWNSPFRAHIYNAGCDDLDRSTLRAIDWQRGSPYVWRADDLKELMDGPALFARKFSSEQMAVVEQIARAIEQPDGEK